MPLSKMNRYCECPSWLSKSHTYWTQCSSVFLSHVEGRSTSARVLEDQVNRWTEQSWNAKTGGEQDKTSAPFCGKELSPPSPLSPPPPACLVSLKSKRWCHWRCSHFLSLSFFLQANSCDLWWRSISWAISLPRLFSGVTARKPFGCPCQWETHQPQHINSYPPSLAGGGWGAL